MIRIIQGDITTLSVDPVYRDSLHGDADLLTACYRTSLALAAENGCRSIAFPCISTGVYGYPIEDAARIAVRVVEEFLTQRRGAAEACCTGGPVRPDMEVIFCCFSERDAAVYRSMTK